MTDITELAQRNELLIANGQQTADLLRHLADNEIDSDYFAVVSECESYGKETDAELSITEFALRAAGYVDALVEALASEKRICATWRKTAEANSEKLEKAQQRIGKLEKKLTDHKRMNQEMAKAMLTPNDSDAAGMEIAALRQRIAGLESRTVTVKLTDINEYLAEVHDKTLNRAFRLLAEGVRAGDVAAMRAAGIKVEAE
ncbi:ead/Ea22-like family protein [Klebsiella pneumoniae]|uniref:ead/Ea22-like family protein n=1 Tax=Klebsiella pneumoniae TaxID=573 RepID=UPI003F75BEED